MHFSASTLRRSVGDELFYAIVSELDPTHIGQWRQMVEVQRTFHDGEPAYDVETRTYSESMRHTLHWSMVFIFESSSLLCGARSSDGGLYGYFVRLHPTAFKANGACALNPVGMAEVAFNTHASMIDSEIVGWLSRGLFTTYPVAIEAAKQVRSLRRARGLSTTTDGYLEPQRATPLAQRPLRRRALRHSPVPSTEPLGARSRWVKRST